MIVVVLLQTVRRLSYLRRLDLHWCRQLWLGTAFAITVLALLVPLSAATFARRASAVHARSQLSRGVQTSRLGISGDAIEGGTGGAVADLHVGGLIGSHEEPSVCTSHGLIPRATGIGFTSFVAIAAAVLAPVPNPFIAPTAPRGPPTASV